MIENPNFDADFDFLEPLEVADDDFAAPDFGGMDIEIDLDAFDLGGDDPDMATTSAPAFKAENRYVKPPIYRHVKERQVKYERAEEMASDMGAAIIAGDRIDALISGNFIFGDFIEALIVGQNLFVDDLTISTLSIGRDNVDSLQNLIQGGYIGTLNLIVSDYFWSHNRQNAPYIYDRLDVDDKFQLAVSGTHTKITLIRAGDLRLVIHGSANFRSSRSVETFTAEHNPRLYDFHHSWHTKAVESYGTIKKAVRAGKLFDLIAKERGEVPWHQK